MIAGCLNHQQDIEVSMGSHGWIPWLLWKITGQRRLKKYQGAQRWWRKGGLPLVGCGCFFPLRSNLQEVIVSILDLCKLLHASCHTKVFFLAGWNWGAGNDMFFFLFYLLMNPMFEEHEVIFETYDFVFSRTCQGSFHKKRNAMSEHVRNMARGHYEDVTRMKSTRRLSRKHIWYPWQQDGSDFQTKTLESLRNIFFCSRMLSGILLKLLEVFMWRVLPRTRSFEEVFSFYKQFLLKNLQKIEADGGPRSELLNEPEMLNLNLVISSWMRTIYK